MSMNPQMSEKARMIGELTSLPLNDRILLMRKMMRKMRTTHPLIETQLLGKGRVGIPLGIFSQDKLSCLESMVKYLKESRSMKLSSIAKLLNRDNRTIWATYHNAFKKMPEPLNAQGEEMPASLIAQRDLSVLEHVVFYAKTLGKTNHEVALILHLDDRTIWSVYDKAKRKKGGRVKV